MYGDAMHLLCYFIYVLFAYGINVQINVCANEHIHFDRGVRWFCTPNNIHKYDLRKSVTHNWKPSRTFYLKGDVYSISS